MLPTARVSPASGRSLRQEMLERTDQRLGMTRHISIRGRSSDAASDLRLDRTADSAAAGSCRQSGRPGLGAGTSRCRTRGEGRGRAGLRCVHNGRTGPCPWHAARGSARDTIRHRTGVSRVAPRSSRPRSARSAADSVPATSPARRGLRHVAAPWRAYAMPRREGARIAARRRVGPLGHAPRSLMSWGSDLTDPGGDGRQWRGFP